MTTETTVTTETGDAALDPRVVRTRQVVLAATMTELMDVGFERISIDAIAERSGVARSTIYRNWPDRATLLAEAFRGLHPAGPADASPAQDLARDLHNLGAMLVAKLTSAEWHRTVPSLISAAAHDPAMAQLLTDFSRQRAGEAEEILTRAVERGEIVDSGSPADVLERFVAPFFLRGVISQRPLDEAFIASQVEATLGELLRTAGPPQG